MKFFAFTFKGTDTLEGWRAGVQIGARRFGLEASTVVGKLTKTRYLGRWFAYIGIGTVRLHKFYRGDNDRAPHTHPWAFWTFPLSTYVEKRYDKGRYLGMFEVRRWRFHYRSATFEHIVIGRICRHSLSCRCKNSIDPRPFYTIVLGGFKGSEWGFYPEPGKFVHHKEFLNVDQ